MFKALILAITLLSCWALAAQTQTSGSQDSDQQSEQATQPSASPAGQSSSRDTQIDISPPPDDDKNHPESADAVATIEDEARVNHPEVEEFHQWNPHKAAKDIEVGDFYLRQKNYKAALSRYQEALEYKPNDAVANFRLGQCFEKLNNPQDAITHYEAYLKVLPHGPLAGDAHKALAKLQPVSKQNEPAAQ